MCQQQQQLAAAQNNANNNTANTEMQSNNKSSYSIKRVLQTIFRNKQQQKQQKLQRRQQQRMQPQQQQQHYQYQQPQRVWNSLESLESLENLRNAQMEEQHYYEEIEDNSANEKLAELVQEDEEHDVYVPVRFARTEAGTFFWTTNLQPVLSSFTPVAADEDLLQPSYCYSNTQYPHMQYPQHNGDRWAQA
ncbi:enhancer of split malpha protein [Zeugodacus cucurbitae]|uniref:enhancer of split malpha protein n=1 Tax=Zeugodacus cucurbitae TaxID=28588 RepID=UPI0023D93C8B|nr:enhancer of split malpha protein [Zeugodacus cucurbitae]